MTNSEIIEQLDSIVGTYEILVGNGVNSDILEIDDIEAIREAIKALNAEPCKVGHWIYVDRIWFTCSECGANRKMMPAYKERYCPYCGAKMTEEAQNGR